MSEIFANFLPAFSAENMKRNMISISNPHQGLHRIQIKVAIVFLRDDFVQVEFAE